MVISGIWVKSSLGVLDIGFVSLACDCTSSENPSVRLNSIIVKARMDSGWLIFPIISRNFAFLRYLSDAFTSSALISKSSLSIFVSAISNKTGLGGPFSDVSIYHLPFDLNVRP